MSTPQEYNHQRRDNAAKTHLSDLVRVLKNRWTLITIEDTGFYPGNNTKHLVCMKGATILLSAPKPTTQGIFQERHLQQKK